MAKEIIKKMISGVSFGIGIVAVLMVVNAWQAIDMTVTPDTTLTAESNDLLTVDKWNAMVQRMSGVYTDNNGRVGIGTITPDWQFHLSGDSVVRSIIETSGSYAVQEFKTKDRDLAIALAASGVVNSNSFYLWDYDTSSTQFLVNEIGNFGIGTTDPQALLHLYDDSTPSSTPITMLKLSSIGSSTPGWGGKIVWGNQSGSEATYIRSRVESGTEAGISFGVLNESLQEDVVNIASSGSVGIGTISPNSTLTVFSDEQSWLGLRTKEGTSTASDPAIIWDDERSLRFGTWTQQDPTAGRTEYARITNDGFIGIGTVSPSRKLHLVSDSLSYNSLVFENTTANTVDAGTLLDGLANNSYAIGGPATNSFFIYWKDASGNRYKLNLVGTAF